MRWSSEITRLEP